MGGFEGGKGKKRCCNKIVIEKNHRTVLEGFTTCRDGVERKIM